MYSQGRHSVERPGLVRDVGVQVGPELDQVEGVLGTLLVQLLEPALLLRKLVLDLESI
jgi:hypothetical protein